MYNRCTQIPWNELLLKESVSVSVNGMSGQTLFAWFYVLFGWFLTPFPIHFFHDSYSCYLDAYIHGYSSEPRISAFWD